MILRFICGLLLKCLVTPNLWGFAQSHYLGNLFGCFDSVLVNLAILPAIQRKTWLRRLAPPPSDLPFLRMSLVPAPSLHDLQFLSVNP